MEDDSDEVTRPGNVRQHLPPSVDLTQTKGKRGKTTARTQRKGQVLTSLVAAALGGARDALTTSGVSPRRADSLRAPQPLSVAGCVRAVGATSGTRQAEGTGQGQLPNNTRGSRR